MFEQLPTEIIQTIFAYCENISLPLSSFIFARDLSHERIYVRFAVDTLLRECLSCQAESSDTICDNAPHISRLLECKWMTWNIFKAIVRELQSCATKARITPEEEEDDDDDDEDHHVVSPDFINPNEQGQLTYLHLRPAVQVPKKLLQGPWTQDKTDFLYYLIWNNVSVDWEQSSRGEIATQGLEQAIAERKLKAVASLLSPAVGVVPTGAIVRSAIIDHGCDETIVFYLLNAALRAQILSRAEARMLTDFNFRDPSLWSWAGRMRNNGNRKGAWLTAALKYAGDAAARSSTYDEPLFEDFVRECGRESDGVVQIEIPSLEMPTQEALVEGN